MPLPSTWPAGEAGQGFSSGAKDSSAFNRNGAGLDSRQVQEEYRSVGWAVGTRCVSHYGHYGMP